MDFLSFDVSSADPSLLGTTIALGVGFFALSKALFFKQVPPVVVPAAMAASVPVQPPQVAPAPVVVAAPTAAIVPPAVPAVVAPSPPTVVAPPAMLVHPVAVAAITFAMALAAQDRLLLAVGNLVLDVSPLVVVLSTTNLRCKNNLTFTLRNLSVAAGVQMLARLWSRVRRRGGSIKGKNKSDAAIRKSVFERMKKIMQKIAPNDSRWVDRGAQPVSIMPAPLRISKIQVDRVKSNTAKVDDSYFEMGGLRSDTCWTVDFFVVVKWLALKYGANLRQATYIASASMIDAICVHNGVDPGVGAVGCAPEDFGIEVPASLPTAFVLR